MSKQNVGKCAICGGDLKLAVTFKAANALEPGTHEIAIECPECDLHYSGSVSSANTFSVIAKINSLVDLMNSESLAICKEYGTFGCDKKDEETAIEPELAEVETDVSTDTSETIGFDNGDEELCGQTYLFTTKPETKKTVNRRPRRTIERIAFDTVKEACLKHGVNFHISLGRSVVPGKTTKTELENIVKKYFGLRGLKIEDEPIHLPHGSHEYDKVTNQLTPPTIFFNMPTSPGREKYGMCYGIVYLRNEFYFTNKTSFVDFYHLKTKLGIDDIVPCPVEGNVIKPRQAAALCKTLLERRALFEYKLGIIQRLGLVGSKNSIDAKDNMDLFNNEGFVEDFKAALGFTTFREIKKHVGIVTKQYGLNF